MKTAGFWPAVICFVVEAAGITRLGKDRALYIYTPSYTPTVQQGPIGATLAGAGTCTTTALPCAAPAPIPVGPGRAPGGLLNLA